MIDDQAALKLAREFVENRTESYPLVPTDEHGREDWDEYSRMGGGGCISWNILEEFSIKNAEVVDKDDDQLTVHVYVDWKWSEEEDAEDDVCFEVYIPIDEEVDSPIHSFDFCRVS